MIYGNVRVLFGFFFDVKNKVVIFFEFLLYRTVFSV